MPSSSQLKGQTLPYQIFEQLRTMIVEGTLVPDQRLREQDLERLLGAVSRGPIREALRLLEIKGLVSHTPRRGFRVVSFSEQEITDLYFLRAELEGMAITQLSREDDFEPLLDRLAACNLRMAKSFELKDIRTYLENNRAFHDAIVTATGNRPLKTTLMHITEVAQPLRFNVLSQNLGGSSAMAYHECIIKALQKRNLGKAAKIMREHIVANVPNVLRSYAAVRHRLGSRPIDCLRAQDWPADTISLVVPFEQGSSNDVIARYLAQELSKSLGQSVIVENRTGAGGSIGAAYVAAAEPDGYTFLFSSGSFATSAAAQEVPFDVTKDFVGVSRVATAPFVIVTREDLGASSVEELVAMAKDKPGELLYGSAGIGDSSHMASALFERAAGINMELSPYSGIALAQIDLAAGRLDLIITTVASLAGSPAENMPRLAYTTKERMDAAPDMPTVKESGIDYSAENWWGVFAPTATDAAIIDKMSASIAIALEDEDFKTFIADTGAQATPSSPEALTETLLSDYEQWTAIVEEFGIDN